MLDTISQASEPSRVGAISDNLLQHSFDLKHSEITDISLRGKFILWLNPDDSQAVEAFQSATGLTLPHNSGEVSNAGPYWAIWANPKRWFIICEEADEAQLATAIASSGQVHMSVTDGQCCFHLQGKHSIDLLKKGCSLNFNQTKFSSGQCLQTRLAITKVFLHRHNSDSFDIYVERSYSEYIWNWLVDAAKEFEN